MIDYMILGGGSAGCVLAARLSQDPRRHVMLVEAGRNISAGDVPAAIRSRYPGRAYLDTSNIWERLVARYGYATKERRRYEQAKILGGGSAINALMANRGAPSDYDEWRTLGAAGWGWVDCLPYFLKIERDVDFSGPFHGAEGPLSIRRIGDERISPFVEKVMGTLDRRGHPIRADQNGRWEDGVFRGAVAMSDGGERLPTSIAYLTPEARRRPNLEIVTGATARRILFEGRRAIGAEIATAENECRRLEAGEVIVAAGAIHSPALLLRSGIGPGNDLAGLDIPVIASREGIGENLMEHPSIAVTAFLPKAMRGRNDSEHHEQAIWRYSSGLPGTPLGDMHGAILARFAWHSVGRRLGGLFFWVNKSYSRGRVRLRTPDPFAEPCVDFRMLSDRRDLDRLKAALCAGISLLSDPSMKGYRGTIFPASYSPRVAAIARPGSWNALQRGLLSGMLDVAGPLRGRIVHSLITQGITAERLVEDENALNDFVCRHVGGTWHASGTCRMGSHADPKAVTSNHGKVWGVEGLRICDASLMPAIPCANTNIPTIMIAERIADFIGTGH
jgi:5-(hydroxymethyl)furfural/furfural oxidase